MFLIVVVQLSIAGMPRRLVGFIVGAAVVAIPVAVNMSASRAARVMAWLNPSAPDPLDVNWQAKHGVWALAAGGIGGTGFGDSKMKWSWIPEVENDFIFAIIGEEFGLIGAVVARIEKYFDVFFIDEVQDFGGHDFNFLLAISAAQVNMSFVGDFHQHTFDTSRDGNVNANLHESYLAYKKKFKLAGLNVDTDSLKCSRRCSNSCP